MEPSSSTPLTQSRHSGEEPLALAARYATLWAREHRQQAIALGAGAGVALIVFFKLRSRGQRVGSKSEPSILGTIVKAALFETVKTAPALLLAAAARRTQHEPGEPAETAQPDAASPPIARE